jgi:NitT/TauT family transport system permease protein
VTDEPRDAGVRDRLLSFAGGLLVWETVAMVSDFPFLPRVSAVITAAVELIASGAILGPLSASLLSLLTGFGGAATAGMIIGAAMGRFRTVEHLLDLYIHTLLATPTLIYVPVLFTLFGVTRGSQVAVVFLYAFPFIADATFLAVRSVDRTLLDMAWSFGATDRQVFWRVVVPGAWPRIVAALRIGIGRAVRGMINGEMLIALIGLGALIRTYGNRFEIEKLFGLLLIVLLLGILGGQLLKLLDRRVTRGQRLAAAVR